MRFQEIQEACWTGYRQAGMKKKGDRQVPNCVPVEEVKVGPEITANQLLYKAAAMAMRDASHEGISLDYEQAIRQASKIYGIPYQPSELPKLLAQRQEIDRQLALLKQGKQVAKARRQEKRAPTPAGAEEYWRTHALPTDRIKPATKTLEAIEEDLKKWFKEKWVRFGPDGKIRGDCARGSSKEGKPKCLPQSKAHALGKKGRASSAAKKRREDPNPERRGPARNVATKVREDNNSKFAALIKNIQARLKKDDYTRPEIIKRVAQMVQQADPAVQDAMATAQQLVQQHGQGPVPAQTHIGGVKIIPTKLKPGETPQGVNAYNRALGQAPIYKTEDEQLDEKQDACYSKVKSRYKVWPSAYASGALVQCRKKGAANWGTGGKKK
jgi:hypothetical protein